MGTPWVRYPALYQPSVAKRAESGQIDTIVPMVTVQMGVKGTVLRRSGVLGRQSLGGFIPELSPCWKGDMMGSDLCFHVLRFLWTIMFWSDFFQSGKMSCHQGEFGIPVILEKRWEVEEILGGKKKERKQLCTIFLKNKSSGVFWPNANNSGLTWPLFTDKV